MAVAKASLENLKKGKKFTSETARECARKGQKKSVEARRWNKIRKETLAQICGDKAFDEEFLELLEAGGIGDEQLNYCCSLIYMISLLASLYDDNC